MPEELDLPTWPGRAKVAVALTFDVDGDAAYRGQHGDETASRLGLMSQFRYGMVRGLPRILDVLDRQEVHGTFFVPGATALSYPAAIQGIKEAGHEIGHHGHDHLGPHLIDLPTQRSEIERGLDALLRTVDIKPAGYRAPMAELTVETLQLLVEHGFAYDSSCMGDDRPYLESAGSCALLELPIDWRLDDAPFMLSTLDEGGDLEYPGDVLRQWWEEFLLAFDEGSLLTLVMHPEIMGRGSRVRHLESLICRMREHGDVWFAGLGEVAELLDQALPADTTEPHS